MVVDLEDVGLDEVLLTRQLSQEVDEVDESTDLGACKQVKLNTSAKAFSNESNGRNGER